MMLHDPESPVASDSFAACYRLADRDQCRLPGS